MYTEADNYAKICDSADRLPDVFAFIADANQLGSRVTLDILLIDQYFRWKCSQAIPVEHYLQRLPGLEATLAVPLLVEEYGHLEDRGLAPQPAEFVQRYRTLGSDTFIRLCEELEVELSDASGSSESSHPPLLAGSGATNATARKIGRYEIVCSIGKGSFGEVLLGKDPKLERSVAIKVLNKARIEMAGGAGELLNEARVVAKLDHANIVPVYDFGETDDGGCFIVSRYVKGKELRNEIRKRISHLQAAQITAALARALHAAHQVGVIHRDVKPANVILDEKRQPHLLDFGLALRDKHTSAQATFVGTPAYMSPEQARGESHLVDGRSDIFSLAVILYEMLTGRRPFQAQGADEQLKLLESGDAQPPRQFDDSIPRDLERICLKALSRVVADRYNTAGDFAEEIENWIATTSASASEAIESPIDSSVNLAVEADRCTNLPCRRDSFVGRATEAKEITQRLQDHAVVTIVGAGGVGKTSLGISVGQQLQSNYPGGIWLCEFAPARTPEQLVDVLSQVLLGNAGTLSPLEKIVERLQVAPTLLLFDNCEHLVDDVAELTESLLQSVGSLKILATSREALKVAGECVYQMQGLSQTSDDRSAQDLFIARSAAIAGYRHTQENDATVSEIVKQLEGLPLAIELAAAQMTTMSIEELLRALDNQMETLQSRRSSTDRQATATQTIQWSFDLLAADQQQLLLALSVFVAPFTMDAAAAVGDLITDNTRPLQRLVEQSMVARMEQNGRSRFRLLEPIRQFCRSRVAESAHKLASQRHAYYFADRSRDLGAGIYGFNELEMVEAIDIEWPDLRKAIAWGREQLAPEVGVDPLVAMERAMFLQCRIEGFHWMQQAVECFGDHATGRADVQTVLALGQYNRGNMKQAVEHLDMADRLGTTAASLFVRYLILCVVRDFEQSLDVLESMRELLEANPNDREARFLPALILSKALGDPFDPQFEENSQRAMANAKKLDWPTGQSHVLLIKAMVLAQRGTSPELQDCLVKCKELADSSGALSFSIMSGMILEGCDATAKSAHQRLDSAVGHLRAYADLGVGTEGTTYLPLALRTVVITLVEFGEPKLAANISGYLKKMKGLGDDNEYSPRYLEQLEQLAEVIGREDFDRWQTEGLHLSVGDVIESCEQILDSQSISDQN